MLMLLALMAVCLTVTAGEETDSVFGSPTTEAAKPSSGDSASMYKTTSYEEEKDLTLMVYLCGSSLEEENHSASADLREMMEAAFDTDRIQLLVMTGGAENWEFSFGQKEGVVISEVADSIVSVWPMEAPRKTSMGDPETLTDFLRYGLENAKARDYALILWDHGGGPLDGVCKDALHDSDSLSLPELVKGLEAARLPKKLKWIGFDACLMSSVEVSAALSPFAEYMIASEEEELPSGWNYFFLKGLEEDRTGEETGKRIIDAFFENEDAYGLSLACINLDKIKKVTEEMGLFFESLRRKLDKSFYARLTRLRTSAVSIGEASKDMGGGYDLVDLRELTERYGELEDPSALLEALDQAVVYNRASREGLCGLSVYHPLYHKETYREEWGETYSRLSFCPAYQEYVQAFGEMLLEKSFADWSGLELFDDGSGSEDENRFHLSLTSGQQECFSGAQLIILGAVSRNEMGMSDSQLLAAGASLREEEYYYQVWSGEAVLSEDGTISAAYQNQSLYLTDENQVPIAGPISYRRSDDGKYWYVFVRYRDTRRSVREEESQIRVMYQCVREESGDLSVVETMVYDPLTKAYTRRVSFSEEDYTLLFVDRLAKKKPEKPSVLPGFDGWDERGMEIEVALPVKWQLRLFEEQYSGTILYAAMQVTDIQQNQYCTPLVRVENPNLVLQGSRPLGQAGDLTRLYLAADHSQISPGISMGIEVENLENVPKTYTFDALVLNGIRSVRIDTENTLDLRGTPKEEKGYWQFHIAPEHLIGLGELREISFTVRMDSLHVQEEETRVSFSVESVDCRGFDSGASPEREGRHTLAATADEAGCFWELERLDRDARGGLRGLLHIRNDTAVPLTGEGNPAVNGICQLGDLIRLDVQPGTDAYLPFELSNRTVFNKDYAESIGFMEQMSEYQLMEKTGIDEIHSLKFLLELNGQDTAVYFSLEEPVHFSEEVSASRQAGDESGNDGGEKTDGLLLDDEIQVRVRRVMAGKSDICLLFHVENRSDRDLCLEIYPEKLNERDLWGAKKTIRMAAGSDGSFGYALPFRAVYKDGIFSDGETTLHDLAMTFRYDDYTSLRAHIRFPEKIPLGTSVGYDLFPGDSLRETSGASLFSYGVFETEPVTHGRLSGIDIQPLEQTAGMSAVTLSFRMENFGFWNWNTDWNQSMHRHAAYYGDPSLYLTVENRGTDRCEYQFEHFVWNEKRLTDDFVKITDVASGESKNAKLNPGYYELGDMEELRDVQCDLMIRHEDGTDETIVLNWKISGCDLRENVSFFDEPVAVMNSDGLSCQLLAVDPKESDGEEQEAIVYLRVRNESDETISSGKKVIRLMRKANGDFGIENALEPETGITENLPGDDEDGHILPVKEPVVVQYGSLCPGMEQYFRLIIKTEEWEVPEPERNPKELLTCALGFWVTRPGSKEGRWVDRQTIDVRELEEDEIACPAVTFTNPSGEAVFVKMMAKMNNIQWITGSREIPPGGNDMIIMHPEFVADGRYEMEASVDDSLVLEGTLRLLGTCRPGIARRTRDQGEKTEHFYQSSFISRRLGDEELYEPGILVKNNSEEEEEVSVRCRLNGILYNLGQMTLAAGETGCFRARKRYEGPGTYDMTFRINEEVSVRRILEVRQPGRHEVGSKNPHMQLWHWNQKKDEAAADELRETLQWIQSLTAARNPSLAIPTGTDQIDCLIPETFIRSYHTALLENLCELYPDWTQKRIRKKAGQWELTEVEVLDNAVYYSNQDHTVEAAWMYGVRVQSGRKAAAQMTLSYAMSLKDKEKELIRCVLSDIFCKDKEGGTQELYRWMKQNEDTGEGKRFHDVFLSYLKTKDFVQYSVIPYKMLKKFRKCFDEEWYRTQDRFFDFEISRGCFLIPQVGGFQAVFFEIDPFTGETAGQKICDFRKTGYVPGWDGRRALYLSEGEETTALEVAKGSQDICVCWGVTGTGSLTHVRATEVRESQGNGQTGDL